MMRSIWLLWRKRRDSMRAQEATKTKAAGVKEISENLLSLSFFFLLRVGERLSFDFEAPGLPVWRSVATNVGIWEMFQAWAWKCTTFLSWDWRLKHFSSSDGLWCHLNSFNHRFDHCQTNRTDYRMAEVWSPQRCAVSMEKGWNLCPSDLNRIKSTL